MPIIWSPSSGSPLQRLPIIPKDSYDWILSTLPLPEDYAGKVIQITPTLTSQDHEKIRHTLSRHCAGQALPWYAIPSLSLKPDVEVEAGEAGLPKMAGFLAAAFQISASTLLREMSDGYEKSFFDFHTGLQAFHFINSQINDDFFIPFFLPEHKGIITVISRRKEESPMDEVVMNALSALSKEEVNAFLNNIDKDFLSLLGE